MNGPGSILATLTLAAALSTGPAAAHRIPAAPEKFADRESDFRPTVDQDIAALDRYHAAGRNAARRLVERGPEILDRLHAALAAPGAGVKQRIQLMTVLAQIGDPSSVPVIVAAASAAPDETGIVREALRSLAELPAAPEAADLAASLLSRADVHPLVTRDALVWFAQHRDAAGAAWADRFVSDPRDDVRATALYLDARLGRARALEPIAEWLARGPSSANRYGLLLGLAELTDPAGFDARVPERLSGSDEAASARRQCALRVAGPVERESLARSMVRAPFHREREVAVAALIDLGKADALTDYLGEPESDAVRAEVRHGLHSRGYRVNRVQGRLTVTPKGTP